jgi:hypothetical protein
MKVFSLEKYIRENKNCAGFKRSIELGWPQKDDGKTKKEFGDGWCDAWAVEQEEWLASNQDTATIKGSKLEYHLLPPEQLAGMAEIMNKGEISHVTGYMEINPRHYWNAVFRHLMAIRRGERFDEEGNSHALAIACNGVILDRQLKAGKELRFEK